MRVCQNHTLDSTRWQDFEFRAGDIVIASWAKAGTTWLQQIAGQLIFGGRDISLWDLSPWIENRMYSRKQMYRRLAAQPHRRFVKTHLSADALPLSPLANYLYIARDGRDVAWSWYHHHRNLSPSVYEITNGLGGRVGPPFEPPLEPFDEFFRAWLARDGFPLWPFWSHIASWWQMRTEPNVLLVHFADLKLDLAGQIRKIADFLQIDPAPVRWDEISRRCSFEYMKANAQVLLHSLQDGMLGGPSTFMRRGTAGGWRESLSAESIELYQAEARKNLPPRCREWLEHGSALAMGLPQSQTGVCDH